MPTAEATNVAQSRSSQTPRFTMHGIGVLAYFCMIQFLIYFDRGVMAGLLSDAKSYFGLDGGTSGLLGSSYFISIMIVAPVVASLLVGTSGRCEMYGMALGSILWASATSLCFISETYSVLLLGRILTGLGESFSGVLASPIIEDAAPPGKKSLYLGAFFGLVYIATGAGYGAASIFLESPPPGASPAEKAQLNVDNWSRGRMIFAVEAVAMLLLAAIAVIFADKFHKRQESLTQSSEEAIVDSSSMTSRGSTVEVSALRDSIDVIREPRFFLLFLGYAATIFSIGGFNFWAPTYLRNTFGTKSDPVLILGAITIVAGLLGTGCGALVLERMVSSDASKAIRCRVACFVSGLATIIAIPFGCVALLADSEMMFLSFVSIYLFFVTAPTAPTIVAMMQAVLPHQRGIAMGLASFGSHIFGDAISPVIVGAVKDWTNSLLLGMWILVVWSVWSVLTFIAAGLVKKDATGTHVPESADG
eukprot:TRINITY_DN75747_c0_g1_i1.p1 TRINITY_DN75747_c0_g1~~TRINITY_DN75747_c0_g1_i1.p1  ORF type:complete len:476 (-),score=64.77 TRINITY_DN75747_c0_g1_i1:138-1565(-)